MDKATENIIWQYSPGGVLENWESLRNEEETQALSEFIKRLSLPLSGENKIRILSPSANKAGFERRLAECLGAPYQLVCGDISLVKPVDKETFIHLDARKVPFADKSFSLICDFLGAAYYDPEALKEYFRLLVPGGGVILDYFTYTSPRTDEVLKSMEDCFSEPERFSLSDQCEVYFVRRKEEIMSLSLGIELTQPHS
ncbi:MAG TPA: class I SAM-dependent methyltransferase [Patescibacteria group bacterium]|nr:class I SAM-dependent methyltransferase [Patescibacteria group bacterium]